MLDIGLVGLGTDWETLYKPVLLRLRSRLRVRAIHTAVATRADPVSAELGCHPAHSLTALMERHDLKAVVILDAAWYGVVPAELAAEAGKPVFVANAGALPRATITALAARAASTGAMLMPDLRWRYLPATMRLRELIATRLGRPLRIEARFSGPEATASSNSRTDVRLVELLDWFRAVVGTAPSEVSALSPADDGVVTDGHKGTEIRFSRPAKGGDGVRCVISTPVSCQTKGDDSGCVELIVHCEQGSARVYAPASISWWLNGTTACSATVETLSGERGDLELMLDHFARRVAGGLVPVPTFEDLANAWELYHSL